MKPLELTCQVCKQDHHNKNNIRFCDRSDLEIAYNDLKATLSKVVNGLYLAQKIMYDNGLTKKQEKQWNDFKQVLAEIGENND